MGLIKRGELVILQIIALRSKNCNQLFCLCVMTCINTAEKNNLPYPPESVEY